MSIDLSPKNRVYIRLNSLQELKSPEICVSLNSNEDKTNDNSIKHSIIDKRREECNSCLIMRRIICSKDMAINKLSEDRDQLKAQLTITNNQNIQLNQRLKRTNCQKQEPIKSNENSDELIEWKAKCDQLEAINKHLRQHLNTLKVVFNELHNSSESTIQTTTTNNTTNTSTGNTSDISNTLVNEMTTTLTDSNITTSNTSNHIIIDTNHSVDNQSSTQTSKSCFDKWYNK